MKINEVADILRGRILKTGLVPNELLVQLSDMDIIESYIICPECGWRAMSIERLKATVLNSASMDDFWLKCGCFKGENFVCGGVKPHRKPRANLTSSNY